MGFEEDCIAATDDFKNNLSKEEQNEVEVEVELGQLPSVADSSVFCPVRLRRDLAGSGYLTSHRAGFHRVELPMVGLLQEPAGGSVVEHLVCTRASPALPSPAAAPPARPPLCSDCSPTTP